MDFRDQLFLFLGKIDKQENFALSRYGDGERMLMFGETVGAGTQAQAQDNRTSYGMSKLGEALKNTLGIESLCFYYAIPCTCCNNAGKERYRENLATNNLTYANVFINNNYQYFKERLTDLKREVVLIANYEGKGKKYPFPLKEFHSIPDDCVKYFDVDGKEFVKYYKNLAKKNTNQLFLISAGPLANIIVYEMYKQNPNNTYIDMGSALDERVKGRITRGFQRREDFYAKRYCNF